MTITRADHGVEPICTLLPIAPSTYHAYVATWRGFVYVAFVDSVGDSYRTLCDEEIPLKRLALNPAIPTCVDCAIRSLSLRAMRRYPHRPIIP